MLQHLNEMELSPGGWAGWIGGAIAAVVAAAAGIRHWLRGDSVARAESTTNVEFLRTLMEQLNSANERADRAEKERNEAVTHIGELKAQIAMLQLTVNHMQAQLAKICGNADCPMPTVEVDDE